VIDPADERHVVGAVPKQLLVGGAWTDAAGGATFAVRDPATGDVLCSVADATPQDGMSALAAAVHAQAAFAATTPRHRADMLAAAYRLVQQRLEDLALLITLEMGKPLAEARGEVAYAAEFFRHFAEEAVRISGDYQAEPEDGSRLLVSKVPVGPCLLITPWNYPLAMGACELAPAIAAGCSTVVKPSSQAPLSMLALVAILCEAGVPDGVVNVVTTSNPGAVVEPQIRSGLARKLTFTGSTDVGRHLLRQAADQVLRTAAELSGNTAFVVFPDADLDVALEAAVRAKMRNAGQSASAANRFYVHRDVSEEFTRRLVGRMGGLKPGRGTEAGVEVGPLVNPSARDRVQTFVDDAVARGARVRLGGRPRGGDDCFYPATVLTDVPDSALIRHEDVFGPVAAISSFDTEAELIAAANDTRYGLAGYLYTRDLNRALRVAEALECGMVGINQGSVASVASPFGGIKASGLGREGGRVGIEEFLESKVIGIPRAEPA